jgi:hypothetical protein
MKLVSRKSSDKRRPEYKRSDFASLVREKYAARAFQLLSDAHRAAIDEALAEHRQAPNDVLTLEQVLSGIRRKR